MTRILQSLACLIISLFLSALVTTTVCQAIHQSPHDAQKANPGQDVPVHSVLCDLACHIGSLVSTTQPNAFSWTFIIHSESVVFLLVALLNSFLVQSRSAARAPPFPS